MAKMVEEAQQKELCRRRANKLNMTITEQISQVKEIICDEFCRYPDEYLGKYKDPDEANDVMDREVCSKYCPLNEL